MTNQQEELYQKLQAVVEAKRVLKDEPMSKHTSFKIGGKADFVVKINTQEELKNVLEIAKQDKIPWCVLGNGSNVLVRDEGIRGIVILNNMNKMQIECQKNKVQITADSGVKLAILAQECLKKEIAGFEFASGIPGTIGGAVRMNAGAHGREMKDIVIETTYLDEAGKIQRASNPEQEFSYRKSIFCKKPYIILQTTMELEQGNQNEIKDKIEQYADYRRKKQPIAYPSAGSTFKRGNDYITAELIDKAGLKGYQIGGAKIADIHAGFIVNEKNATAEDVLGLIQYVKQIVKEKFGKTIELEIEVLGEEKGREE